MPSDTTQKYATARCYCGASQLSFTRPALITSYCHCADCRRWTGAPVAAFTAFPDDAVVCDGDLGIGFSCVSGVTRWNCGTCGSPLMARFDYLPNQSYVPVGILDQARDFAPETHSHSSSALPWLCLKDDLPRESGSARAQLNNAGDMSP